MMHAPRMIRRRRRQLPRRLRGQSLNRLVPNIVTLLALCAGLTAVRFGLEHNFQSAVIAIGIAAVLDGLDGRIARLMGATSRFGAELDSLCDFVCFGTVPALLLYLWEMQLLDRAGWTIVLIYAICTALRLARFNTALDVPQPPWAHYFFTGVPAPAGAGLVLLPLISSFVLPEGTIEAYPLVVAGWIVFVGALMISRIPTFAMKRIRVPNNMVLPTLLLGGVIAAGLATETWITFIVIAGLYLLSIPFSMRLMHRLRRAAERSAAAEPAPEIPHP
jgi:CDP-diacylglycerol--serine O-phosphatidyltransferase